MPANYAPVEEGYYDLGPLEWAGNKFDYSASWGTGLGPIWVSVEPAPGNITRRAAIGLHLDANRDVSPGSAGCIVFRSVDDLKIFVSWFSHAQGAPTKLIVNWGLGTVKSQNVPPQYQKFKLFANASKVTALKNGSPSKWSLVKFFLSGEKLACNLNFEEVDLNSAEVIITYREKPNPNEKNN